MVAGPYGAGALVAPPERPPLPDFPTLSARLGAVREDFGKPAGYLAEVDLPPTATEGVHTLSRIVRQDLPEAVDSFVRTRWWTRLTPGQKPPERHLERQLTVLREEAEHLASALRDAEVRRQETHTRHLEERGG